MNNIWVWVIVGLLLVSGGLFAPGRRTYRNQAGHSLYLRLNKRARNRRIRKLYS